MTGSLILVMKYWCYYFLQAVSFCHVGKVIRKISDVNYEVDTGKMQNVKEFTTLTY